MNSVEESEMQELGLVEGFHDLLEIIHRSHEVEDDTPEDFDEVCLESLPPSSELGFGPDLEEGYPFLAFPHPSIGSSSYK